MAVRGGKIRALMIELIAVPTLLTAMRLLCCRVIDFFAFVLTNMNSQKGVYASLVMLDDAFAQ